MASRSYERLSIEVFGRHLITSGDLDPVYIALHKLHKSEIWTMTQIHRWLVAYWCFYHCGFASYVSDPDLEFWGIMREAARNETEAPPGGRWPRGRERRHARGRQGVDMVADLELHYQTPSHLVRRLCGEDGANPPVSPLLFKMVSDTAKEHTLFGPWISFKVADMVDRVLGVPVSFEQAHVFMFKDPMRAAEMLFCQRAGLDYRRVTKVKFDVGEVVAYLEETFSDLLAPPLFDRPIGLQEVETVLCCWKSHMNGHYPLNNDIDEIQEGLRGWGTAASAFSKMMPEPVR